MSLYFRIPLPGPFGYSHRIRGKRKAARPAPKAPTYTASFVDWELQSCPPHPQRCGSLREAPQALGDRELIREHEAGPWLFVASVPEDQEPQIHLVLRVPDEAAFTLDPGVQVVMPFTGTHFGTREMTVHDLDGRSWSLQAAAKY
jgi:hypothetical protein